MTSREQDKAAEHVLDDQAAAHIAAETIRTNPGGPTPHASGLLDHLADELDDVTALREGKAEAEQHDIQRHGHRQWNPNADTETR
jgi:hypothetical protein